MAPRQRENNSRYGWLAAGVLGALASALAIDHADAQSEAGSLNLCLQTWVTEREVTWQSQRFDHAGVHTVTYSDGTTIVERPDGTVDIVREETTRSGKRITVRRRICRPGDTEYAGEHDEETWRLQNDTWSPESDALLECATADELDAIRGYRQGINALRLKRDELAKPLIDAREDARKAQEALDKLMASAPPDYLDDPDFMEKLHKANADASDAKTKERNENERLWTDPEFIKVIQDIQDEAKELKSLLDDIESRGACPPKEAVPHAAETLPPPEHAAEPPSNGDGALRDILGHVTIGVGVGGGGGHHDDHHNQHDTRPDNQPATKPGG